MIWRYRYWIEPLLFRIYQKIFYPPVPNLKGDRDIENSWIAANMPEGPGRALDFGCGPFWLGLLAARKGFEVTAIDLQPVVWHFKHPSLSFIQDDIFKLNFPPEHFDLIINCSTIEHIGLSGRYGMTKSKPNGDIEAMVLLKKIMKPEKTMLLTIPVGQDRTIYPLHRIYGENRLPELLKDWEVVKKEYYVKDNENCWIQVEESFALNQEPSKYCYGLGLFVLIS